MSRIRPFLLILILSISANTASLLANETVLKNGQSFALRIGGVPGDEMAMLNQKFSISDAGLIRLPYLKEGIRAAGLKPSELARSIEKAYVVAEIYTQPTIQIDVSTERAERYVSVMGEVRAPQTVGYLPGITLLDAIAQAGGFTDFAYTREVKLTRGQKISYHRLSSSDPGQNVSLEPNDIITVRSGRRR
ncbi:MAG: polysaccharide biosynthesis/export family protein [Verrucomicrobiales bacterium]